MKHKQLVISLLAAVLIIALDQWTKSLASSQLNYGMPVTLLPIFDLNLQHNSGAAFSFLADAGGWQRWFFTAVSAIVSLILVVWLWRLKPGQQLLAGSLSLILAGAVGNLWDRIELGYVVDFLSFHYQQAYFPAFNVADAAITIGAALMIIDMLLNPDSKKTD
jgi:signal peptidase II